MDSIRQTIFVTGSLKGYGLGRGDQTSQQETPRNEQVSFSSCSSQDDRTTFTVADLAVEAQNAKSSEELEKSFEALYQLKHNIENLATFTYFRTKVKRDIIAKMQKLKVTFGQAEVATARMKESRRR